MGTNQRSTVTMTDAEVAEYVRRSRTATMATLNADGSPHLVAMWYAVLDGEIWFETKSRSQKAVNLRRDPRLTVLLEDGQTYDVLRGVSLEGRGVISEDPDDLWRVGVDVFERCNAPYTDDLAPLVEVMIRNRVAVRLEVDRIRSWDHRKLGMDPMPFGGTTAGALD
ncbi:MAG: pyridoxamine 5'-phosphate oxidase family protein [Actinomycetota bacterium]|nr:PPOX class F420-dependent oxidoreductase [Actinomycetota bacterium]